MADFPDFAPHCANIQHGPTYYKATAPDGRPLHGSSALKRYSEDPMKFGALWTAQHILQHGDSSQQQWARSVIKGQDKPDRGVNFGNLVDAYLFNQRSEWESYEKSSKVSIFELYRARQRVMSLRRHSTAGPLVLSPTMVPQVSHAWQDPESGIWLRSRKDAIDYLDCRPSYWDLKVWVQSHPDQFWLNVKKWGVKIQLPLYRRAACDMWGENINLRCGILVCGPKENDHIYLRWISDELMDEWDDELSYLLERLAYSYQAMDFTNPDEAAKTVGVIKPK